jgi:hypothetical protein
MTEIQPSAVGTLEELRARIAQETDEIWSEEPPEVRAMRLGVFTSDAGTGDQYFSNLVFINGDLRTLSTWTTPKILMKCLSDDRFTLEQCQDLFAWINLGSVDFLAYCGFVKLGRFARSIIDAYPLMNDKTDLAHLLEAWYIYSNRLYFWVHHAFPWGLGVAFPKLTQDDFSFVTTARASSSVDDYFAEMGPELRQATSE